MSARPWMPLYCAEFISDTAHMSAAERGAYIALICHYWTTGKPLPDDQERLRRITLMSEEEWAKAWQMLCGCFSTVDGNLHHKRIDHELAKATSVSQKRKMAGKAGAEARYGKQSLANARDLPKQSHGQSPSQSHGDDVEETHARPPLHEQHDGGEVVVPHSSTPSAGIVSHFHAERRRLWPTCPNMAEPPITSLTTAKAWLLDGVPAELLTDTITRTCERMAAGKREPPVSMNFFAKSVADAKARLDAAGQPLPRGNPTNGKRPDHDPAAAAAARRRAALERHGLGGMEPGGAGASPWPDEGQVIDGDGRRVA